MLISTKYPERHLLMPSIDPVAVCPFQVASPIYSALLVSVRFPPDKRCQMPTSLDGCYRNPDKEDFCPIHGISCHADVLFGHELQLAAGLALLGY